MLECWSLRERIDVEPDGEIRLVGVGVGVADVGGYCDEKTLHVTLGCWIWIKYRADLGCSNLGRRQCNSNLVGTYQNSWAPEFYAT